jgi:adenylylsulfate kinase
MPAKSSCLKSHLGYAALGVTLKRQSSKGWLEESCLTLAEWQMRSRPHERQDVPLFSAKPRKPTRIGKGKHVSREQAIAHGKPKPGLTVWFTGLSGAGKTTICRYVQMELAARDMAVEVLDGDVMRTHLCKDLGYSEADRKENIRRIADVAKMLTHHGKIVLVAAISPYRTGREEARSLIGNFIEVYVNAPLAVCEQRDPKGLYHKARIGMIHGFTGIDAPYEAPPSPDVECLTDVESPKESCAKVVAAVMQLLSR